MARANGLVSANLCDLYPGLQNLVDVNSRRILLIPKIRLLIIGTRFVRAFSLRGPRQRSRHLFGLLVLNFTPCVRTVTPNFYRLRTGAGIWNDETSLKPALPWGQFSR